jgi:DNA repair exonuclease SbcCD ATPase subunit
MRKSTLILGMIIFFGSVSFAQTKNDTILQLQQHIENLENLNSRLSKQVNTANSNIRKLEVKVSSTADSIDALKQELIRNNINQQALADKLELQLQQLNEETNSEISALKARMRHNNTQNWILTIITIILILAVLIAWLRNRLTSIKSELSDQIKTGSDTIREEIIKIDNQVFWSLDMLKGMSNPEQDGSEEIDHSFALKVADEIIRIQKYISNMNPETKGVKQLEFAVERIQDNFSDNGYEMVELLNKPYEKGMKMLAKFKSDRTLNHGEQIITRIIKPQVNYKGVMIQAAEVEVSVGE